MSPKHSALLLSVTLFPMSLPAQSNSVTPAINQLGLDLLRARASGSDQSNLLLSPYSIEVALAMAYSGAEGRTRDEMRRVLHLPADDAAHLVADRKSTRLNSSHLG